MRDLERYTQTFREVIDSRISQQIESNPGREWSGKHTTVRELGLTMVSLPPRTSRPFQFSTHGLDLHEHVKDDHLWGVEVEEPRNYTNSRMGKVALISLQSIEDRFIRTISFINTQPSIPFVFSRILDREESESAYRWFESPIFRSNLFDDFAQLTEEESEAADQGWRNVEEFRRELDELAERNRTPGFIGDEEEPISSLE